MLSLRNLSCAVCHCSVSPAAALGTRRMVHQTTAPRHGSGAALQAHGTAPPQSTSGRTMAALVATAAAPSSSALGGSTAVGAAGAALAALLDPRTALQGDATAAARIFPNENADAAPWEASCIELGVEAVAEDDTSTSFGVTLNGAGVAATRPAPATTQTVVRLYFETARREGLHSFRSVAQRVALGELPGRTENRMSVGYAVWIVPRDEYIAMLAQRPQIAAPSPLSPSRA